ncbi:MAG: PEP/pyruvate-binding domain-containing protein [Bacteroidia bacterium]
MAWFSVLFFSNCSSKVYVNSLESKADFDEFCGPPLTDKYNEIKAVKVIYDLRSKKVYYINFQRFHLHHEFCSYLKGYPLDLVEFNKYNYSTSPEREYLLGNINFVKSSGIYTLELSPTDLMSLDNIKLLYEKVSNSSFIGDKLKFLLNSSRLNKLGTDLESRMPIITPADIYGQITYQPIYRSTTVGTLRFVKESELDTLKTKSTDIIVLDKTPLELPHVSGVVVSEFQTPLSHLTILGQNRKTPICAVKGAFQDSALRSFENQKVEFKVMDDGFDLKFSDLPFKVSRYNKTINLKYDLDVKDIVLVEDLSNRSRKYTGNKAANFGMLHRLSNRAKFKTPEGAFAIPFYFYDQHIKNSGAQKWIDSLLSNDQLESDSVLRVIRKKIKSHPVSPSLLLEVEALMSRDSLYHRMRFRSSTNAEDANGFSGAGLYSSKTGILFHDKKTVERAIQSVWSSLWSEAAFLERSIFQMDQSHVYMAILAHRSFPNESVNGVAITKNLYRQENEGFIVNAQIGNESVVNPSPGVTSDQFICFPEMNIGPSLYSDKDVIEIINTSSLSDGTLLLSDKEIVNLANQLYAVKRYFSNRSMLSSSYLDTGFDVEFKLDGDDRQLYIKQVRLYND